MLIIFVFLCEVNNAFERVKKRSYKKKYYFENKDIIFTRKKEAYYEDLDKSREEFATRSKTNYNMQTPRQWRQVNCQIQG